MKAFFDRLMDPNDTFGKYRVRVNVVVESPDVFAKLEEVGMSLEKMREKAASGRAPRMLFDKLRAVPGVVSLEEVEVPRVKETTFEEISAQRAREEKAMEEFNKQYPPPAPFKDEDFEPDPVPFKKGDDVAYAKFHYRDGDSVWRAQTADGSVLFEHGDWKDGVLKWFDDNGWLCQVELCGRDNSHLKK